MILVIMSFVMPPGEGIAATFAYSRTSQQNLPRPPRDEHHQQPLPAPTSPPRQQAPQPAIGLPDFTERFLLHYAIPDGSLDSTQEPLAMLATVQGNETIIRGTRQTGMYFEGGYTSDLAGVPVSQTDPGAARGAIELDTLLKTLTLNCRAGRGSYSIALDSDRLVEQRPGKSPVTYKLNDRYFESFTVANLLTKTGAMKFLNGAVITPPAPPPLMVSLDCAWMFDMQSMMMPPLPQQAVRVGQKWEAGIPMRFSVFALPQVIRINLQFQSRDETSHDAVITWSTAVANQPVKPAPGISYVGDDAYVSATVQGQMVINTDTGLMRSSEVTVKSDLTHLKSSSAAGKLEMYYKLRPEPPAAPAGSQNPQAAASGASVSPDSPAAGGAADAAARTQPETTPDGRPVIRYIGKSGRK